MNDQDREIQRRLRVLRHAEETGNVRQTCRYFGMFYNLFWVSAGNTVAGILFMGVGYWAATPEAKEENKHPNIV